MTEMGVSVVTESVVIATKTVFLVSEAMVTKAVAIVVVMVTKSVVMVVWGSLNYFGSSLKDDRRDDCPRWNVIF